VAVELTRARLRSMIGGNGRSFQLSKRVLVGLLAAALAVAFTSVLAATHNAQRDEAAAQRRQADTQALLALPPVSVDALRAQLDQVRSDLATAQAGTITSTIDPGSDAAATLLVLHSQAAGLSVRGISRPNPATAKFDSGTYDVQGLRITVEGTPAQVITFLADMKGTEPALYAVLGNVSIGTTGIAHAEVGFNAYTKQVVPTVVPRPAATPGAKR
jgi:hypothetical protein